MKIAIFADLHDNQPNLEKFLAWCSANKIETLIACGDITNEDTLRYLAKHFPAPVYLIRGNMDLYPEKLPTQLPSIIYLGRFGITEIADRNIGLCHEPEYISQCMPAKPVIVFYGHTHKPWMEKRGGVELVNPGTLGGVFTRATFAYWDTEKGEMKLVVLDQIN